MRRVFRAAALLLVAGCRSGPETPARPNVLLVTLDTTRADRIGAYGAARAETPSFDRIAREGLLFENAWTVTPLTTPAHASLMTGLYPPAHGVRNNGRMRLADAATTLAEAFSAAGYRTGAFVAAFTVSRPFGLAQGFDRFDDDFGTDERGRPRSERRADQVNARALPWLAESAASDRPFFAWIHYYDAHDPYDAPGPIGQKFRARPYDGEIAYADTALGHVLEALEDAGALDTTIVVVAGDHGEALGEHGEPTHGLLVYEATLHVPLAMRAPWAIRPGRSPAPASLADLAPTIAALAHVALAGPLDGIDLLAPGAGARSVYAESLFAAEEFGWAELATVRRGTSKWIAAPSPERYDLGADPRENDNLAGRDAETDRALAEDLVAQVTASSSRGGQADEAALDDEMRARLASLGYVGSGGAGASPSGTARRDPKDGVRDYLDYLHGTEAINRGDDAVPLFERLVAGDPGNPEFRLRLAQARKGAGDLRGAEADYRELVRRYPDYYLAYRRLGALYDAQGRARESRDLWLSLRARGAGFVGVDARLAEAYLANDEAEQALAAAKSGLTLWPGDAELIVLAARASERLGRDDDALAGYREALAVKPSDLRALDGATALLRRLGRRTEARGLVEDCLRRSAGDPGVRARLAGI